MRKEVCYSLAQYACCPWNEQTRTGKLRMCSSEVHFLFTCYCVLKRCSKNCWLGVMVTGFGVCKALEIGNSKDNKGTAFLSNELILSNNS